jgi:beta-N-acetylhexosaminidase
MRVSKVLVVTALVGSTVLVVPAMSSSAAPTTSNLACATKVVETWSLTRVARETVVVSAQGTSLASLTSAAAQGYGGFILFGTTAPATLPATLASLRRVEPDHLVPLVMSDDEGGEIIRFSNLVGQWPWPQTMGATMTSAQIMATGERVGAAMLKAGLNVDLAPVADVDGRAVFPGEADPDGYRSFGASPTKDAADVVAFATGLMHAHVVSVVKHFPGLGGTSPDTDYGPAATKSWAVLQSTGLVPCRAAIKAGVNAIMMSNASVPGLTTLPAGLSPQAVSALRHQLGFHGLLMTDALGAGAISALHLSIAQASVKAIGAGVDEVLGSNPSTPAQALQTASLMTAAIVAAVEGHTLTRAQVVSAAAQVVAATNTLSCPS